jgi:hypothetical protein
VLGFGLTTIDLLENAVGGNSFVSLEAYNSNGQIVDTQTRTSPQGPSGFDLDWFVSSNTPEITEVHLAANVNTGGDYGIDDLVVARDEDLFGQTLKIALTYEFSLEQYTQKTELIQLVNTGEVARSATLETVTAPPAGDRLIEIVIDPAETILELDEFNNRGQRGFEG